MSSISFATYNILNPYHAVKWAEKSGLNELGQKQSNDTLKASTMDKDENAWRVYDNWEERVSLISNNIQAADIVCLQEVSSYTIGALQESTGYQLAAVVYHASNRVIQQFGNAILYNPKKVRSIESSEIVHGSGESSRSAAYGTFEIDKKVIGVASVHLAGYSPSETNREKKQLSKESGFKELETYVNFLEDNIKNKNVDGVVIGGDFNEDLSEKEFDLYRPGYLQNRGYLFDGNFAVTEPFKGRRIDWLCYKPLEERGIPQNLTSMKLESKQSQASDHLMTGTVIEWKI